MNEPRVLLADASNDFTHKMSEAIRGSGDLRLSGIINNGNLVVDTVLRQQPEVLLLELMLPGCDGISIIRHLKEAQRQGWVRDLPLIIVLSAIISDSNTYLLRDAGIDYYMVKPVTPTAILERIRDLLRANPYGESAHTDTQFHTFVSAPMPGADDIDCDLTALLIDIGIPASLSGYTYLREAIRLVIDGGMAPEGILSKRIYPVIAKKHGKSIASVEKAIRTAIETAWIRGRTELLDRLFGYTVSAQRGKPTNTEFIAMIADRYAVYGKVK